MSLEKKGETVCEKIKTFHPGYEAQNSGENSESVSK